MLFWFLRSLLNKRHYFLKFYPKNTKLLDFFEILPKLLPKFYFIKTFPKMKLPIGFHIWNIGREIEKPITTIYKLPLLNRAAETRF